MEKYIYFDIDSESQITADGAKTANIPHLVYGDKPIWKHFLKRVDADGNVLSVDVSDVSTWEFAIAGDLDKNTEPWIRVLNENIDSSDAANGIITVKIDTETTAFLNAINNKYKTSAYARLRGTSASKKYVVFYRINASADVDPNGGTPGENPSNYYTKAENDALDMKLVSSPTNGHILTTDGNGQAVDGGISLTNLVVNPMTTEGDLIVGGVNGNAQRLAKGSAGQILRMNSSASSLEYATLTTADVLEGSNKKYVTDAEKTILANTSGVNTGDQEKCTGAEIDAGTNDAKFATPKAIADSGLAFVSDIPNKAGGNDVIDGTDDAKYVTSKALADAGVTLQGNTFNSAGKLVKLDGDAKLPAVDGSQLLNLPSGFANPMTTEGDLIVGGANGNARRLAKGSAGQVLKMDSSGSAPQWDDESSGGTGGMECNKLTAKILYGGI